MGRHLFLGLVFISLLLLTSCSILGGSGDDNGGASQNGQQALLEGEARLACTDQCAAHYQCGPSTLPEGRSVILLHTNGPATVNHNMIIPVETTVVINQPRPETAVRLATQEQIPLNFYQVTIPEQGQGWVAGWCLLK